MLFACCLCILETCEFSCGNALCVVLLCSKVSIFQPEVREHSFRTIVWYLRLDSLEPELARTRGKANPRRRDCESRCANRPNRETTFKDRSQAAKARTSESFETHDLRRVRRGQARQIRTRAFRHARSPQRVRRAQDKLARLHSESASTRTISAEGSPSSRQTRTAPQRERFDTHDLRRGFAAVKRKVSL